MTLPIAKTKPKTGLAEFTTLIHGMPKIGKSSFVASAPDVLFLPFEAGLSALEAYQTDLIESWDQFLGILAELNESNRFKTLCIDTVEQAYTLCLTHVCKKLGIQHPADVGFSKGWFALNHEFYRVFNKLSLGPRGLFLIAHSKMIEVTTKEGTIWRTVPYLSNGARNALAKPVDTTLFFTMEEEALVVKPVKGAKGVPKPIAGQEFEKRMIRANPSIYWEAGSRVKQLKNLPDTMPMEFEAFAKYFEEAV